MSTIRRRTRSRSVSRTRRHVGGVDTESEPSPKAANGVSETDASAATRALANDLGYASLNPVSHVCAHTFAYTQTKCVKM